MFISVIPALKMPAGHDFFDYKLEEGSVHVGDLIFVPFRNHLIPGLVAKISPTSQFAEKAITIPNPDKILKLPEILADYCRQVAHELFVSPATLLHAWLRVVPKRLSTDEPHTPYHLSRLPKDAKRYEEKFLVNRYTGPGGLIETVQKEQANGRILILTPWQSRVDYLKTKLGCQGFHALTAAGAAWKAWTGFLREPHGMLVTTRLGAWLGVCADIVIIDEPENDDYKQDELTPRYDARRLVRLAMEHSPALRVVSIGTTPRLESTPSQVPAPIIDVDLKVEPLVPGSRSNIESLSARAVNLIAQAVEDHRSVRILHAVGGARGRIRCADCGWIMPCPKCGYGMSNFTTFAQCRRCGQKEGLPLECPMCGGPDLARSIIGSDLMQKQIEKNYPKADVKVLDLSEWQQQTIPPKSLIVITNINSVGGYTEDVRRKERLVIAFRRLASQAMLSQCELFVQGPENLVNESWGWLDDAGLKKAWSKELDDRRQFGYPPARRLIKLIAMAKEQDLDPITVELSEQLGQYGWEIHGPYKVENRPNTREPRLAYHLIPPKNLELSQIIEILTPFSSLGILDLDPIAFFS
jgi:primosomal protein N'